MDVLYVYKHSPNGGFEILHSLRSVALYAPYIRKVWIFGDKPPFMADDTSIIEHVPHEATARAIGVKTPVVNFFLLTFLSSLIPDLSSEYLFFSDDFFLLKHFPEEEARKDRTLEDMSQQKTRGHGMWVDALWRTYDVLIRLGYTGINFETHTPAYMTKKRVLDAYSDLKDFVTEDRWYGLLGPTAILNHAYTREKMPLTNILEENSRAGFWVKQPTYDEIVKQCEGKQFFNFDDPAFGEPVGTFLMEKFPHPCKYEKSIVQTK
jgi:hypothetical protein